MVAPAGPVERFGWSFQQAPHRINRPPLFNGRQHEIHERPHLRRRQMTREMIRVWRKPLLCPVRQDLLQRPAGEQRSHAECDHQRDPVAGRAHRQLRRKVNTGW
jgi:hypothetical protein